MRVVVLSKCRETSGLSLIIPISYPLERFKIVLCKTSDNLLPKQMGVFCHIPSLNI